LLILRIHLFEVVFAMFSSVVSRLITATLLLFGAVVSTSGQSLHINEILADNETNTFSDGSISDWVELYNSSSQPIALAGYSLTDAPTTPRKWVFPANVSIPANGFLVVLLDSSRPASTAAGPVLNAGFSLKSEGDHMELFAPGVTPVLVDSVRFGPQAADFSIGRIPSGTGAFVLTQPTPGAVNIQQALGSQASLRINEWMASPPGNDDDWFEVYNPDPLPVQLSGLHFKDSANIPSPVAPLSFIGVGLNGFLKIIADNSTDDNEVDFGLSGNGDVIGLFRADNSEIDRVVFGQQTQGISQGRLPDGSGSILSLTVPTPGRSNLILYEGLIVNELLSHTDPPLEDAVEFRNVTANPIDISGWYLSDSRNDLRRYQIPAGTVVPANGYIVFYENQFNGPNAITPFSFNSVYGDDVYLSQAVNGSLTGYIVQESFEPAANGISFGRVATSVPGDYKFVALQRPTFGIDNPTSLQHFRQGTGALNADPMVGPVVINEIMYNPPSLDGFTDNTMDEFIELLNIASTNVPLYDVAHPENRWRLQGAVAFSFPANTVLPANSAMLIVSFDPSTNATVTANFRSKYGIPAGTTIVGPYDGKLNNSRDEVELYRPDAPQLPGQPDAGYVPFIRVDKVNYSDVDPWPAGADGTGQSLQRIAPGEFGNDPINWRAATPTPGQTPTSGSEIRVSIATGGMTEPVQIQFNSSVGRSYTVQMKDNLQSTTQWQTLQTVTATSSTTTVQDPNPPNLQQRYYRVIAN
jgi:hypothetical protein